MARLTISLLGPFRVALDGESVTAFESDKVRALLAYLTVEAYQPHRRETLAGLLWPERPERSARHSLSQALLNLRKMIGDAVRVEGEGSPFLLITHQTVQLNRSSDHTLDVTAFEALLAACEDHHHDEIEICNPCMERLRQAIPLYQGDFLEGFSLADSPAFEEWAVLHRERLHRLATDALHRLAGCYEGREELEQALQHAWRWVELDPWQERAHRQVMRLLALSGRRNAALKQYRVCRHMLIDELGVEPDKRTTELFEQIRDGKYERPELSHREKDTRDGDGLKSRPVRLLALIVISALFLVLGLDLLPGFLRPGSGQTSTYSCTGQADIPETECHALVALHNETGGADWKDSSGWLSDSTPCSWFGVSCSGGSVIGLSLPDNNLSGSIPPALGDLRRLEHLDLYGNLISGPIPSELGNLTNLTSLDLSYNLLSGSIPPDLSNLSNLRYLTVCGNSQLGGPIPPELGDLIRLESLCLSSDNDGGTKLSGPIPPELGNLRRLTHLDISNSLVSGPIPPELGNLTNLTFLGLVQNPLSGPLPPELGNLVHLRVLSVGEGYSELEGPLPLSLMNLKELEYLTYGVNTDLCEPPDAEFREWLDGIPMLNGPRVVCQSEGQ